jgi:hypothetical protein
MSDLSINNVINISVSQPGAGLGQYNTSNLALFTAETPLVVFSDAYKLYLNPTEVATDFGTGSSTYKMALGVFSQQPNILAGGGYLCIIPYLALETLDDAITRTAGVIQYFGVMSARIESQVDILAAAAVIQTLNKIAFFVSKTAADVNTGGMLDLLRTGGFTQSRGLFHGVAATADALVMMASYAGRALSVNFNGSNTTTSMHLKDLAGVQPDPSMNQTLLNKCEDAGVDVYISIQGVSKTFTSGKNAFFDDVYNLQWLVGSLQIAGFNALAQTGTKIPQTENGMNVLKSAYRQVCEQALSNQYAAPGSWTSPTTFGNQSDLLQNIIQRGYYIYSTPISQQSPAARAAREAPLVQIALKAAGAIHSSSVIVTVNV